MDPGPKPTKLPSVQMNISLDTGKVQKPDILQPKTTLRIGLLDTGASFNLISHRAYAALKRPMRPCQASVQCIAGDTEICGSIDIEWRFLPADQTTGRVLKNLSSQIFHIIKIAETSVRLYPWMAMACWELG